MNTLALSLLLMVSSCTPFVTDSATGQAIEPVVEQGPPVPNLVRGLEQNPSCTAWVDSVMATLDLRQRIGQLMVFTIAPKTDQATRNLLHKVVAEGHVGGLLFSGGQLQDQVTLTIEAQELAQVPLMITFDGEWGLAMRLKGTPTYPRNRVLGCITHDELLHDYGREVARQCREIGVTVNFAPVADVDINPANPIINTRSFGDDPQRVARQVVAYARGLESGRVLSVSKHFPGHGDTDTDSHLALPLLPFSRQRLDSIELVPFRAAIEAGLGGIMVGHLEVPALEPTAGRPTSLSSLVVDSLLHGELRFSGLTFTDALAMKGVGTAASLCLEALRAGNDVLLVPQRLEQELDAVVEAVQSGTLSEEIINTKCRKVLRYKYALGLTKRPDLTLDGVAERVYTAKAKSLATTLKKAAVTVLQNQGMLPLIPSKAEREEEEWAVDGNTSASARYAADPPVRKSRDPALLIIGSASEAKVLSEVLSEQLTYTTYSLTAQTTADERKQLRNKLRKHDRILVCVTTKSLQGVSSFLSELKPDAAVAYLLFIGARDVTPLASALQQANAVVLAHSADADVQRHVARILLGQATADGRLSVSIPGLYPTGTGVTLIGSDEVDTSKLEPSSFTSPELLNPDEDWSNPLLVAGGPHQPAFHEADIIATGYPHAQSDLESVPLTAAEIHGFDPDKLGLIDSIALEGIRSGAYPGCQIVVLKDGVEVYNKAFGTQTWPGKERSDTSSKSDNALGQPAPQPVQTTDVYDLASLTKITSTLLAVMKLYDEGRIQLNDRLSTHLAYLRGTNKEGITIREVLLHESGLPASLLFYENAIDKDSYTGPLFRATRDARHPVRVGSKTWANPKFQFIKGLTSRDGRGDFTIQVSDSLWLHRSFRDTCLKKIVDAPMRDKRYRYSDVGFILLQQVVEQLTGMSLSDYVDREFYQPMGLTHTGYCPLRRLPREAIIPSASDRFLRKTALRGFVHDEAAAFQGGVSGNAGLFSTAHEVALLCEMMLAGGVLDGHRYLSAETIRTFTTTLSRKSRRALGFDKPDRQNPAKSPCSAHTPASTFGHTGFTGTCAWMDPDHHLVYVFLSNRIWPDVWNTRLMNLDIRPRIQDAIYAALLPD